jgi:hypothetical protein
MKFARWPIGSDNRHYDVSFLELPGFPTTAPARYPHIINTNTYTPSVTSMPANLKLHDVVSTMLYNLSGETLGNFYDTKTTTDYV